MINEEKEFDQLVESLIKDCNTYMENQNRLDESGVQELNEGLWEKIKYGLSKLGRYKAGGKIMGKKKIDAAAAAQIKAIVDKKGNEVIRALDAKIKESNPKFPNNEKEQEFLQTILDISTVYDSIVNATKLTPEDKGFLPIDVANGIIEDLAAYVKKYLDVDLAAVYSTMDENVEEAVINPDFSVTPTAGKPAPAPAGGAPAGGAPAAPLAAKDVRTQMQGKVGAGATTRDSQRMQTLKSNKLPLILAGVGTALGALGWLAQTDWLKNLIMEWIGGGTPGEDAVYKTVTGGAADSQGMVHWMSQIDGKPMNTIGDVNGFIDKYGAENVSHMFDGNGSALNPMEQVQKLQEMASTNPSTSVGEAFKKFSSTYGDMKGGRNLFGVSKAGSLVAKVLVKEAVKAVAGGGGTVVATVAGIGSVLLPLGIGLIGAGALVKLMRMKGQKQSRAKTLNDLFQSLQPLKGTEQNPPVVNVTDKATGGGEQSGAQGSETISTDKLYANLYRFLTYLKKSGEPAPEVKPAEDPRSKVRLNPDKYDVGHGGGGYDQSTWDESIEDSEDVLSEGRFINNRKMLFALNKQMGADRVKQFENFLARVEKIKNVIQKVQPFGVKSLDAQIKKLQSNPIMSTDFTQVFKSLAENPNQVVILQKFINDILKTLSSGKFNVANLLEATNPQQPSIQSDQTIISFKKNLFSFIGSLINTFEQVKTIKSAGKKKAMPVSQVKQQPVQEINEQLEKMKHLMNF